MAETGDRLAAIRARTEAATDGPWHLAPGAFNALSMLVDARFYVFGQIDDDGNRDLCRHAREDIPWLLNHVRELRRALDMALRDDPEWCSLAHDVLYGPDAPGDGS